MSQHGYMRHTAMPPLVLDLIRLSQSASCGKTINFYLLSKIPNTGGGVDRYHWKFHRPTGRTTGQSGRCMMRSVSDGRWLDVVEGALLQGRQAADG